LILAAAPEVIETISIGSNTYRKDEWTNVSPNLINAVHRKLHLQSNHPLAITREIIESRFPDPIYKYHNNLFPVVSTVQNFDSLGFPEDHPGRSRKDTYYVNKETVLRTHTSAHEADVFRANKSAGYLISADVYRRDAIDRSHYPIFHQMEGARMWSRKEVPGGDIAKAVMEDFKTLPTHDINIEDPNPTIHPERNPLQSDYHSAKEVEAISKHLKRSLENVVIEIFSRARVAAQGDSKSATAPIQIRWIEAYFPHTSPSWELEVFWEGDWLELLGCGVVKQELLIDAGVPDQLGWAFGLGLERIAMLLFNIPDIRLFWSQDDRFLSQFSSSGPLPRFIPFSKHPACYKDVAFWLRSSSSSAGGGLSSDTQDFHENDVMEVVRDVAGDSAEDVRLVDQFIHPSTSRRSLCYRINYRSLDKTLTNTEANQLHEEVRKSLVERLGVELR
jgi:phenylalanyl-tRNA synthetase alpha chain